MAKTHLIIELSPISMVIALLRGNAVIDYRVREHGAHEWSAAWPGCLGTTEKEAAAMVRELGAVGSTATVIYAATTAVASVFSCPASAGEDAAARAATLALCEQVSGAQSACPRDAEVIASDRVPPPGKPAQAHTLAVIDHEPSAQAVAAWARQIGVEPVCMLPAEAPTLLAVTRHLARSHEDAPKAVFWFGESASVLAASAGGSLRFARVLRLGTETLVDVLCRPIRKPGSNDTITLGRAEARSLLATVGVPTADQHLAVNAELRGASILPLIQPVLQRIGIEIKQSLRFSFSEAERAEALLELAGPGALIPRMGEVLAGQSGISPLTSPPEAPPSIGMVIGAGPDARAVAWNTLADTHLNLLPSELETVRWISRVRRVARVGAALALALIALHGMMARMAIAEAHDEVAKAQIEADEAARKTAQQTLAINLHHSRAVLKHQIEQELGPRPDWAGTLALLSKATPANIRIATLEMALRDAGPEAMLVGYVNSSDPAECASTLRSYSEQLSGIPLVRSVRLGATQRTPHNGVDAQRFELSIGLVALPPSLADSGTVPALSTGANP